MTRPKRPPPVPYCQLFDMESAKTSETGAVRPRVARQSWSTMAEKRLLKDMMPLVFGSVWSCREMVVSLESDAFWNILNSVF